MKKTIALLLALAMLLSMAACGGSTASTTTTETTTAAETTAAESTEEAAEAAPAAEAEAQEEAAPAAEESAAPEEEAAPAADEVQLLEPLSYPVSDGTVQLTYWYSYPPFVPNFLDDVSDKAIFRAIDEAVGVDIKVVGYSLINASEQFQLMIASSEYTDIIYGFGSNYTGSVEGAVEDEIIVDLSDKLEEYAPDYANYLLSDEEVNLAVHTDAGYVPSFCGINDDSRSVNGGLIIRSDYLDAVGMELPTTYSELEDVLRAFKTELGVESPYWSNPSGYIVEMTAGYDMSPEFYVQDGVVKYGFYEDAYYDYLSMMNSWYEEGLLYQDFAAQSSMQQFPESDLVNNNKVGVWFNSLNEMTAYDNTTSTDPNFAITGVPVPSLNKGDTTHFETITSKVDTTGGNFISTNCENVELAMAWCNYWYTDEGTLLANYGIEGETWNYDENGEPKFTDMVVGNPDLAFDVAISVYCEFNGGGYYVLNAKTDSNYNDVQLTARENWTQNSDTAYNYPGYASLNAEESEVYTGCIGDVTTYVEEMTLKFITGATELNEQTFADYQNTLKTFGVEDCIEVYQAAYDRYLER